jgi:spermidine synthase
MKILLILIIIIILSYFLLNKCNEQFTSELNYENNIYMTNNEIYQKVGNFEYSRLDLKTKKVKHWYAKELVNRILKNKKNKKVLILGVALGGIIINLLNENKNMKITAVDIEDTHFNFVKKYSDNKRLKLIKDDANNYVMNMKEKYDAIVVDIFIEDKVPNFVTNNNKFLNKLQQKLNFGGIFIINTMRISENRLKNTLKKIFTSSNVFVMNKNSNYLGIALK